jgi:hypothetical protein
VDGSHQADVELSLHRKFSVLKYFCACVTVIVRIGSLTKKSSVGLATGHGVSNTIGSGLSTSPFNPLNYDK